MGKPRQLTSVNVQQRQKENTIISITIRKEVIITNGPKHMVWPSKRSLKKHSLVPRTSPWEEERGSLNQSFDVGLETEGSSKGTSKKPREWVRGEGGGHGRTLSRLFRGTARRLWLRTPANEVQRQLMHTNNLNKSRYSIKKGKRRAFHDLINIQGSGSGRRTSWKKNKKKKTGSCAEHLALCCFSVFFTTRHPKQDAFWNNYVGMFAISSGHKKKDPSLQDGTDDFKKLHITAPLFFFPFFFFIAAKWE